MNTIDKIRAEIERLLEVNTPYESEGYRFGLLDIRSFLDTLEEPVEKTCKTCGFYENNCPFIRGKFIHYPSKVCKDYTFSTLKAEQEPVSEDLEDELENYYGRIPDDEDTINAARHFAEWQKAKMMEGAVEGKVIVPIYDEGDIWSTEIEIPGRYEPSGSKIKIIVVKEDGK